MRPSVIGAAVTSVCICSISSAAVNFTGSTLTENFNNLPTSGTTQLTPTNGKPIGLPQTMFDGGRTASGSNQINLLASNGSTTTGALYSFGSTTGDRGLGSVASSLVSPAFGIDVVNKAANTRITAVTISFTQENWRLASGNNSTTPGTANVTAASYGTSDSGVAAATYLNSTGFTSAPALNLTAAGAPAGATALVLDGEAAANRATRTMRIGGLDLVADEQFFLRFQDPDETGNDAGMGIDDFSMSFETTPIVGNLAPAITFAAGKTMTVDVSPAGTNSIADTIISAADSDGVMSSFSAGALPASLAGKLGVRPGADANSLILSGDGLGYGDVGTYTVDFTAIDNGGATTVEQLTINVVPEPASLICIAAAPLLRRRRR